MSIFELLILAIGLSMDSFAVSVTSGVVLKPFRISSALKIASFLALFQGAMPLIGWFIGREFSKIYTRIMIIGSLSGCCSYSG